MRAARREAQLRPKVEPAPAQQAEAPQPATMQSGHSEQLARAKAAVSRVLRAPAAVRASAAPATRARPQARSRYACRALRDATRRVRLSGQCHARVAMRTRPKHSPACQGADASDRDDSLPSMASRTKACIALHAVRASSIASSSCDFVSRWRVAQRWAAVVPDPRSTVPCRDITHRCSRDAGGIGRSRTRLAPDHDALVAARALAVPE